MPHIYLIHVQFYKGLSCLAAQLGRGRAGWMKEALKKLLQSYALLHAEQVNDLFLHQRPG